MKKMREFSWNGVIWNAVENLKNLAEHAECKYNSIDEIFLESEKKLHVLKASQKEAEIRLFALALYCDRTYNLDFFNSMTFVRFGGALDFFHFERVAKTLIENNSFALIVFWVVFRLSFRNSTPENRYQSLEREMRNESMRLSLLSCPIRVL